MAHLNRIHRNAQSKRHLLRGLLVAAVLLSVTPPATAGFFEDQKLAVQVSAKLQYNKKLWRVPIQVDVHEGVAMLSGNVPTAELVREAGKLAAGVKGVKRVENHLKVGPPVHETAPTY